MRTHDAFFPNGRSVHQGGTYADQRIVADGTAMEHSHMAHRDVFTHRTGVGWIGVADGAVLNIGAAAYGDAFDITTKYSAKPYARIRVEFHIADQYGRWRYEYTIGNVWFLFAQIENQSCSLSLAFRLVGYCLGCFFRGFFITQVTTADRFEVVVKFVQQRDAGRNIQPRYFFV